MDGLGILAAARDRPKRGPLAVAKFVEKSGGYDKPGETAGALVNWLRAITELPYFGITAIGLTCFALGLWIDWLLRRFDGSRSDALKSLGYEFDELADRVERSQGGFRSEWPQNIGHMLHDIVSAFVKAHKLGIVAPKEEILERPNPGRLWPI